MMLGATGRDVTVDSLYKHPSIAGQKGGLFVASLQTLSKAYGVPLKYSSLNLDTLKERIDEGKPVMVLVDYKVIVTNKLNGIATGGVFGHFALVVGYDDESIIMHDPYWKTDAGAYRHWPTAAFNKAWAGGPGSWGNNYNGKSIYPVDPIAQRHETEEITFPMDEGLKRRIRAKAMFEKESIPRITDQEEYDRALSWLGGWGQYGEAYYVQPGDTLGGIALKRFGMASFAGGLAAYNGLEDADQLAVGQKILIPLPSLDPNPDDDTDSQTPENYTFTNQQVINAFYQVYRARGGDADDYWQAIVAAEIEEVANYRNAKYSGPAIEKLPNIPEDVKLALKAKLGV